MVLADLVAPAGRILDRLAVAGKRQSRSELDRALERGEVLAERVGARVGIEAHGRRDRAEQVIAGNEDAVAQQAEMAVCVTGQLEDLPTGDLFALPDRPRVAREADERAERGRLVPELGRSRSEEHT